MTYDRRLPYGENALTLLAVTKREIKNATHPDHQPYIDEFIEEATDGDYDHLTQTCEKWLESIDNGEL